MDHNLDLAESALESAMGGRRESEVSFLQCLLRDIGATIPAGMSPARLFQTILGRGPVNEDMQNALEIVARPSERPQQALRPGDWMLRVVPGTGDVGHVTVLVSDDLQTPSLLAADGIDAESTLPGQYGLVIEAGAFPHTRSRRFARRWLDGRGRVPPHSLIVRPRYAPVQVDRDYDVPAGDVPAGDVPAGEPEPEAAEESDAFRPPAWLKIERRSRRGNAPSGPADSVEYDLNAELMSEEIAELLPPRTVPSGVDQELLADEAPPLPKGIYAFEHWVTPEKRDEATKLWIPAGAEQRLEPLDPGFFDGSGELKPSSLDQALKDLLTGNAEFNQHLSRDAIRDHSAKPGDKLRVALVDLTGRKLLEPQFAGWGSTVAVDGASCLKIAPLYAAFQLRNDLKHVAAAEKITTTTELVRVMTDRWKRAGIVGAPKLDRFLYHLTNPPDLEFTAEIDEAVNNIIDQHKANHSAKVLIDAVGYQYIASLMWQSGLRHPTRGGMWLMVSYEGGAPWSSPSKPPPGPVFGRNGTALSLATFFTLLAQDRLARSGLPRTIKTTLSTASWFSGVLPSASIASKVGLYLRCLEVGPKMKDRKPVVVNGEVVQECKRSIATHVHEAGLIENGPLRYAVAILTVGVPTGVSLLQRLIGELDGLIRANNP